MTRSRTRRDAPRKRERTPPGRVFVISSPSGGGKTSVVQRLREQLPDLRYSVSVTTRRPRAGEQQGKDYRFIAVEEFQRLRRSDGLLEWARVHDAYYGTPKLFIRRALREGRHVLLSIDVQGARQIRRALGKRAVLIFLLPPSLRHLRERLERRRTETAEAIRCRLAAAKQELACASWYDYTVVNDQLDAATSDIKRIMTASSQPLDQGKG